MQIPEIEQKNLKKLLLLKIIAFELGTTNTQNPDWDIYHWQSMCYEAPRRCNISLRETFSKSETPRVMKKSDQSPLMEIPQEFETL